MIWLFFDGRKCKHFNKVVLFQNSKNADTCNMLIFYLIDELVFFLDSGSWWWTTDSETDESKAATKKEKKWQ